MNPCRLCPRECGIDRQKVRSFCHAGEEILLSHSMLHKWEEPCISGKNGTGAVFFGGCPLGCVYCQNAKIVRGELGREKTPHELADLLFELKNEGAHNIDLVTPTHFWDRIDEALTEAISRGFNLPVIANTGGFEKAEILSRFATRIDVFLTDFKYLYPESAGRYSAFPRYADFALPALRKMREMTEKTVFDEDGMIQKGVIVRHLVLPEHTEESKAILSLLYEEFGNEIAYSIMNQYTPPKSIGETYPELAKPLNRIAYKQVVRHAERIGITNGFIQEGGTVSESFIPAFGEESQTGF